MQILGASDAVSVEQITESRYPRTINKTGAQVRFNIRGKSPTNRTSSPRCSEHGGSNRNGNGDDSGKEDALEAGSGGTFFHRVGRTLN